MAGLNIEIWERQIQEQFIPKNDFLQDGLDYSLFTTNDGINVPVSGELIEARFNPTLPMTVTTRTDDNNAVIMHDLATQPTRITNPESVELSYDKMESVIRSHRDSLQQAIGNRTLFEIAPASNAAALPVIAATGTATSGNPKPVTKDDIAQLAEIFDKNNFPQGRTLVLTPFQFWNLVNNDTALQNQYSYTSKGGEITGTLLYYYGFKIRMRTGTPNYTQVLTKQTFGTNDANSRQAAIAYVDKKWFFGYTDPKMIATQTPEYLGDVFNFWCRFGAGRLASRAVGAIVSINA